MKMFIAQGGEYKNPRGYRVAYARMEFRDVVYCPFGIHYAVKLARWLWVKSFDYQPDSYERLCESILKRGGYQTPTQCYQAMKALEPYRFVRSDDKALKEGKSEAEIAAGMAYRALERGVRRGEARAGAE